MLIYLINNSTKFHPNPICNDGDLGLEESCLKNKKNNKKMINVMGLAPRPKVIRYRNKMCKIN